MKEEKPPGCIKVIAAFIRKDFSVQMTKQAWNGEQFKAIFLMFTPKFLRGFYNRLDRDAIPKDAKRDEISLYKLPSNRPDIVSLFESMTPYFDSNIQPTEELLQLKMVEGIYVLLNTSKNLYASIFDFTDPWKIDILEFLESNYMNDISMEEIANYTGRSLSTFKRDFKKCSTLSPREWLIRRRLEAARELIRKGGRKVSDICFEVGFKNLSHFSKIYKERTAFLRQRIHSRESVSHRLRDFFIVDFPTKHFEPHNKTITPLPAYLCIRKRNKERIT